MRPYRGMTKEGNWFYGDLVHSKDGRKAIIPPVQVFPDASWKKIVLQAVIEVLPETVGQSTGREDENKEEIYTGDKIGFIPIDGSTKVRQIAEVYYDEKRTAFCVRGKAWNCPLSFCKEIEIITRNPELMK